MKKINRGGFLRWFGFVGNIMIDTLEEQREKAAVLKIEDVLAANLLLEGTVVPPVEEENYAVMTLHRPSNVDHKDIFTPLVDFLTEEVSGDMPLFWPIHPRARKQLETFGLWDKVVATPNLVLLRPITLYEHGGASVLVGNNVERIREEYHNALVKERKPVRPELWDGKTAGRCLEAIIRASDI